jgi:hypothetical protein
MVVGNRQSFGMSLNVPWQCWGIHVLFSCQDPFLKRNTLQVIVVTPEEEDRVGILGSQGI